MEDEELQGFLGGATSGALAGAPLGPAGMVAGGLAGGAIGLFGASATARARKRAEQEARDKRERSMANQIMRKAQADQTALANVNRQGTSSQRTPSNLNQATQMRNQGGTSFVGEQLSSSGTF